MNSPRILIFNDFIDSKSLQLVQNYCVNNSEKFKFVGYGSPVRWKEHSHSKDPNFLYQRSFLMSDEEYSLFNAGKISEPYPNDTRHGDNYKMSMDESPTGEIREILSSVLDETISVIEKHFGVMTKRESGPWITKASSGDYMKMHCDGTFIADKNSYTHYSSVFYINDDYEGGIFSMPKMGFNYKPKANSLVLWSNAWDEDTAHEVTIVVSGDRFVSQGFFAPVI